MIAIRRASLSDVPALHALVEGAYRGEGARRGWTHEADLLLGQRTNAHELAEILGDGEQIILIAEQDGAALGCVHLRRAEAADVAHLGMLSVDPNRQAAGLGSALIDAAEEASRELLGARRVEMTVIAERPALIAYYERRDYQLTGERRPFPYGDERFGVPTTDTLEFVVLEKTLPLQVPSA